MHEKIITTFAITISLGIAISVSAFSKTNDINTTFSKTNDISTSEDFLISEIDSIYKEINEFEIKAYEDANVDEQEQAEYTKLRNKLFDKTEEVQKLYSPAVVDDVDRDSLLSEIKSCQELYTYDLIFYKDRSDLEAKNYYKYIEKQYNDTEQLKNDFLSNKISAKETKKKLKDISGRRYKKN